MIAYVRGSVASVAAGSAVVDVGGIGLELQCAPGTLAALRVGQKVHGEPLPRIPVFIDLFLLKGNGAETPVEGEPGEDPWGE